MKYYYYWQAWINTHGGKAGINYVYCMVQGPELLLAIDVNDETGECTPLHRGLRDMVIYDPYPMLIRPSSMPQLYNDSKHTLTEITKEDFLRVIHIL